MGKLQDFFELRTARKMLRRLERQLHRWQRDFKQTAKTVEGMPRPTGTDVPPMPNALQHLPEDIRELRHYVETMGPQFAQDEELLREQVLPIYKGVSLLEALLANVRDVYKTVQSLQRLLETLTEYEPYHQLLLETADDLPVPIRKAMRVATQLGRVKWHPLLEQLRALQHLCESDPILQPRHVLRKHNGWRLLPELDPHWRGMMRVAAMQDPEEIEWDDDEPDEEEWDEEMPDEEDDEEVDHETAAHLRELHGHEPIEEESDEEEDDEDDDYDEVAELQEVHRTHLLKRKPLDDIDEGVVEEDDDEEWGDDDDDDGEEDDDDDDSPPIKNRFTKRIRTRR